MKEMCKDCLCPNCEHFDFDSDGACELCRTDKPNCCYDCPDYLEVEWSEKDENDSK